MYRSRTGAVAALLLIAVIAGSSCRSSDPKLLAMGTEERSIEDVAPSGAMVLDPMQFWITSMCGARPLTDAVLIDMALGHPRFLVFEPLRRHVWINCLAMRFDPQRYPIAVMSYRARHVDPTHYVLWMNDGSGSHGGGIVPFHCNELVQDGEIHELRKDLRTLNPKGNIEWLWLGCQSDATGPGEFELFDLRFEADPSAAGVAIGNDERITLRVVDSDENPVAGATVVVDAEFRNWARAGTTNRKGKVKITPLARDAGSHMVRISKPGMVTIEARSNPLPEQVVLPRARIYGGIIRNEQGQPVPNVAVHLGSAHASFKDVRWLQPVKVLSDASGRWQSPPLPDDLDKLKLRMTHLDYVRDSFSTFYQEPSEPLDTRLASRTFPSVLVRGLAVHGVVIDHNDQPIRGASVTLMGHHWSANHQQQKTKEDGAFRFEHNPPGIEQLKIELTGYQTVLKKLHVGETEELVKVRLVHEP